jgi:SNF family Na+-dependent transporter
MAYNMYRGGGVAYLLVYIVVFLLLGLPLVCLETLIGQYGGITPHILFRRMSPLLSGLGVALTLLTFLQLFALSGPGVWFLKYIHVSLSSSFNHLGTCDNAWNTENCFDEFAGDTYNATQHADTYHTPIRIPPTEEFWINNILRLATSTEGLGELILPLVISLVIFFILVFLAQIRGIKSYGKMCWVTAILPVPLILILLIRALTLPGSGQGLIYLFTPRFEALGSVTVIYEALISFVHMGAGMAVLVNLGSYNRFHNSTVRDVIIAGLMFIFHAVLGSMTLFGFLGYFANITNRPIQDVIATGIDVHFVTIPLIFYHLPGGASHCTVFFLYLFLQFFGGYISMFELAMSSLVDVFPWLRVWSHRVMLTAGMCGVLLLPSLLFVTETGYLFFVFFDTTLTSSLPLALFTSIGVVFLHTPCRLLKEISRMRERVSSGCCRAVSICTGYCSLGLWVVQPILLLVTCLFSIFANWYGWSVDLTVSWGESHFIYPSWALILSWLIAAFIHIWWMLGLFGALIYCLQTRKGCGWLFRPLPSWDATTAEEAQQAKEANKFGRGGYIIAPPPGWANVEPEGKGEGIEMEATTPLIYPKISESKQP